MGRDEIFHYVTLSPNCFNPRGRMGRDPKVQVNYVRPAVSIHAAAWAATS